jgi:hypothetical protein
LDIAALAMVIACLLLVAAGTVGMLLVVLLLFAELSGATEKIGSATPLGTEDTPSLSVEPERWENEAA